MPDQLRVILDARTRRPQAIAKSADQRKRRAALLGDDNRLFIIAADHPARGALRVGERPMAIANRMELLERMSLALSRPGVDGVLGTADVIEDLLLLGVLDDKVVIGSMNRGGLAGTVFEIDDRFTGYDAAAIARMGFDGGKMLFRIDPEDPATASTMEACARAVSDLTLPALLLGGEVSADQNAAFDRWHKALQMPSVHGLVVGRTLLFPPDDDVAGAVDTAVSLMRG